MQEIFCSPAIAKSDLSTTDTVSRDRVGRQRTSRLATKPSKVDWKKWLTPVLDVKQRASRASEAARLQLDLERLDIQGMAMTNHIEDLLTKGDLGALLKFLDGRRPHVPRIAAKTLGIDLVV
jgi:hypothetical protein